MAVLTLGDISIPVKADGYDWEIEDISSEDSGMTISGKVFKDIIRRRRKLYITCPPLTDSQISSLLDSLHTTAIFSLTYLDPELGECTKNFYCGNRKVKRSAVKKNNEGMWENLSFNAIEE